ncbi:caspase domain-containing protein [Amycolatopsis japonica]|uniref:caspase family protein n=1 Tax=Amycolatopsis japonica TaxID=208439 RepID=UPI00366B9D41
MRRALLVGIDHYDGMKDLAGCVNDATALERLLARNEDRSANLACRLLTGTVTRRVLMASVRELLADGADFALLYFAGHGTPAGDDVALVTSDGEAEMPGIRFSEVLDIAAESRVKEIVVILDCCFSGGAGTVTAFTKAAVLRDGMSILTASRGDQTSAESAGRGLFSTHLEGALDGGAADVLGHVTVAGLYAYLSECFGPWDQRPTFKANIDRLHDLRRCAPSLPLTTLHKLTTWFPEPGHHYPLDPSYEPDKTRSGLDPHPDHEEIFDQLQKCRANKLVEPVDHQHMYYAAMESSSCRLTALGRHYWQMAKRGML